MACLGLKGCSHMGESQMPHVSISGSGNAVNLGGTNNHAEVHMGPSGSGDEISSALTALRALASHLDGPDATAIETAAATLEGTPRDDEPAIRRVLTMAAAVVAGLSASVVGSAEAVEAVGNAMTALGH